MLHAKILRSPHAHARIKAIDPSRALAFPGVKAVVTAAELPQTSGKAADLGEGSVINPWFLSNTILAAHNVLYEGHAVAAMAAISRHIAEKALALMDVEYEVLPVVLDGREAMQEGAPLVHELLMPLATPHIRPMEIGGGFGGKTLIYLELVTAFLSMRWLCIGELLLGDGPSDPLWWL